jgi:hypothetical protein
LILLSIIFGMPIILRPRLKSNLWLNKIIRVGVLARTVIGVAGTIYDVNHVPENLANESRARNDERRFSHAQTVLFHPLRLYCELLARQSINSSGLGRKSC